MSNFIVNTDIPNLRVVIREGDQYNINIVPGRITTLVTGSFTSYADFAGIAASASYVSGASVSAQFATSASYAETIKIETTQENTLFSIPFISQSSKLTTDIAQHLTFNPSNHVLQISGGSGINGGTAQLSPRGVTFSSGSNFSGILSKFGVFNEINSKTVGLVADPSLVNPSLVNNTNPAIYVTSGSAQNTGYAPLEFQGSGSYTDGRVTVNTPLVAKQGIDVTGSVISDDFQLKAGQVQITFTGSINTGIFGVSEYVQPFISTQSYSGASIEYVAQRSGATRMGIIMATWTNDSNIAFTDFSTSDVGDTSDISFVFLPSGSYYRLRVNSEGSGSGTWTVQTLFKLFPNLI